MPQGGVQAFLIIHILDKIGNPFLDVGQGLVFPELNLLRLQGFDETFGISVVIGISF